MRALPLSALCLWLALSLARGSGGTLSPRLEGLDSRRVVVRVRTTQPAQLRAEAGRLGGRVRAQVGEIASVEIAGSDLPRLAGVPGVISIKPQPTYRFLNDISTTEIGADAVAAAHGARGRGAIVAIIDTGLDFRHMDFRNSDGTTRVVAAWDQGNSGFGTGCGPGFEFGRCYTRAQLNDQLTGVEPVQMFDATGHGTHVAGTAAGNGLAAGNGVTPGTYAGVAPEADLLVVKIDDQFGAYIGDLTAAYAWIEQQAAAAGEPFVINMSLGSDFGAHDGTDPDEASLDALLAPSRPGRAAAIASGNSRLLGVHAAGTSGAGQSVEHTFQIPPYTPLPGTGNDEVLIDLWYEGADTLTVSLVNSSGVVMATVARGAFSQACTGSGQAHLDARNVHDPDNGDNEVVISLVDATGCGAPPVGGTFKVRVTGTSVPAGGHHDLWQISWLGASAATPFIGVTDSCLVEIPGTARYATTVGSYVTRDCFPSGDPNAPVTCPGITAPIGAASAFSSNGPTRDGRLKPELVAPGERVVSALSGDRVPPAPSLVSPDHKHRSLRGTSMSSPHVAGALAVLLGLKPSLDATQSRDLLVRNALVDGFTGAVPNQIYGGGKLRLDAAVEDLLKLVDGLAVGAGGGLSWLPEPHSTTYNLYRGTLPAAAPFDTGACLAAALSSPAYNDADIPLLGSAFFYLVTGVSGGIEGSAGTDDSGSPRPVTHPCL